MNKRIEDDPDNLGGLGDLLPAEVLKMINQLLERMQQLGQTNQGSKFEFVYVASGGQHVETQINIGAHPNEGSEEPTSVIPPPEAMVRAVERTMAQGWWASTAWAVVYRVYQMKGYSGGIRQFVREVKEWPFGAEHYYTRFSTDQTASITFLDASVRWLLSKRIDLAFAATNLFDETNYRYTSFGSLSESFYSFNIRPRNIIIKMQIKI